MKNREFKILGSMISEMYSCEWGHCSEKDQRKNAEKIISEIYVINHYLSSDCCFNPQKIWKKYKKDFKGWYGQIEYNYWNKLIEDTMIINIKNVDCKI